MIPKITPLIVLFFLSSLPLSWSQNRVSISGIVSDAGSGETLIGASVEIISLNMGTITNEYGYYGLSVPIGNDSLFLRANYIGFEPVMIGFVPNESKKVNIKLGGKDIQLNEVVITANTIRDQIKSTQMSVEQVSVLDAKVIPALFGEVDIIKTIQLKPGISSGSEGSTGLFVRGGNIDQNLIVLDEAIVYNADHLFGFFSVFNADALKDVKVYKGGFPAQYGGRLSSVIDVRLKEGNKTKYTGSGGIGLISSRLTLEGPIQKDKSSFIVSGRRTYVDLITNAVNRSQSDNPDFNPIPAYNFYDLNVKGNVDLGDKDRLFVSGYFGRDVFGFNSDLFRFNFDWGNATGTVRWNHLFNNNLFSNLTFTYSDYQYNINNSVTGFSFNVGSNIRDANLKYDLYYTPGGGHEVRSGIVYTYHQFTVGRIQAGSTDGNVAFSAGDELDGSEFAAYISDDWDINAQWKLNYGMRLSGFAGNNATYIRPEPRLAVRYIVNKEVSLKASYARMNQYVHLISNSAISLPTDIWYPSTERIKPQLSDQVAVGVNWEVIPGWLLTNEYWYKRMGNLVDFKDHARLFANPELELEFTFGDGFAYGMEFGLEKNIGKLTGWLGYTLAFIRRGNFEDIMGGRFFAPRYDRRHDISAVLIYNFNKKFSITGSFVYGSGDLTWLPTGRAVFQDIPGNAFNPVVPIFGDRNTFRLPAYHRADLGFVIRFFPSWGENDLTISIYNVYDRRNPYFLFLDPVFSGDGNGLPGSIPTRIAARQVSLFPILPSFTWNFKF